MEQKISKRLVLLPEDSVVLIILPGKHYEELHMELVQVLLNQLNAEGAYITLNRPYHNLIKAFQTRKVDFHKLFFLDCVTKKKSEAENCTFLRSPPNLTNIGMALDPIYKNQKFSFIFFDSLDALSLYHDSKTVLRFVRFLIERMRENNKRGILLGLQGVVDKKMIDELSVVCDKVIDLV